MFFISLLSYMACSCECKLAMGSFESILGMLDKFKNQMNISVALLHLQSFSIAKAGFDPG